MATSAACSLRRRLSIGKRPAVTAPLRGSPGASVVPARVPPGGQPGGSLGIVWLAPHAPGRSQIARLTGERTVNGVSHGGTTRRAPPVCIRTGLDTPSAGSRESQPVPCIGEQQTEYSGRLGHCQVCVGIKALALHAVARRDDHPLDARPSLRMPRQCVQGGPLRGRRVVVRPTGDLPAVARGSCVHCVEAAPSRPPGRVLRSSNDAESPRLPRRGQHVAEPLPRLGSGSKVQAIE